jgi:MFS family permease
MTVQGVALIAMAGARSVPLWVAALCTLGVGTALVYPTLLAGVADSARPASRGAAVGVYRFWRDLGYVAGALVAGVLADAFGMAAAIAAIGGLTIASGAVVALRFDETRTQGDVA